MEYLHWIKLHWLEISMVWFPAFLGYLNALAASFKVMGWTQLSDFCGKLEDACKAFVDAKKQGNQNVANNTSTPDSTITGTGQKL